MSSVAANDPPGAPTSRNARPLSRVEQMLHAYYDLEDTTEPNQSQKDPGQRSHNKASEPQDVRDGGLSQKPSEAREDLASTAQASTVERQRGSGALKTALQLLNDIPYLQQSVAAAVSGGRASSESSPPPALDLNSPDFNMQAFFSTSVRSCTLRELLRLTNELEGEVRVLERDIQTLVYENYGKFLSATETVRRVRHAMSDVEGQLQILSTSVVSIENNSRQLMATVHERAAGIEDLVAFRQLIEQLQLLSTLPELLRRHLLAGDAETALLVYEHARIFLAEQHAPCPHLQRLALLRRDADATADYAKKLLKQRLDVPSGEESSGMCGSFGPVASTSMQVETATAAGIGIQPDLHRQQTRPLSSADASRVVRLLLRSGEDPLELLRLHQRGRRHAALLALQDCFTRDSASAASAPAEVGPADALPGVASTSQDARQDVNAEAMGVTLERACNRVSAVYVDLLATALKDSLFILRFFSAMKARKLQTNQLKDASEASEVRRIRAVVDVAENEVAIDMEAESSLLTFLSSLVEAAFSRLSAMIASAVPVAASVVRGTSSVVSAFESSWGAFLPPSLQRQATEAARKAQRQVLLEATALAFKRAYAKVAQELHDAIAAAGEQHEQQLQMKENSISTGACPGFPQNLRSDDPSASTVAALAVALTRQHPAEQSVVVEGCVALTDAQQLLRGALLPASGEAEVLVLRQTVPWVAGLFELFVRFATRFTKDIPAAFSGYPEVLEDVLDGTSSVDRQPNSNSDEAWLAVQVEAALVSASAFQYTKPETLADQMPLRSLPLVSLVLLRIGRSLQQLGLAKVEAIGTELFPSLEGGWLSGSNSNKSLSAATAAGTSRATQPPGTRVASRLRAATQSLMTAYVFYCGQGAAESTVLSLAKYHWTQLQESYAKEHTPKRPSGTSGSLAPLVGALRHCDSELATIMTESGQPSSASAQLHGAELSQQLHRRLGRPFGRRRTAIEREMERLFARKQRVFSAVPFSRTKAVMGVFRIAARAVLEFIRGLYFNASAVQQLQVDCAAASCAIRELVQPEDASVVDGFFDEIVASAALRCNGSQVERAEHPMESTAILLPDGDIDAILGTERSIEAPLRQPR